MLNAESKIATLLDLWGVPVIILAATWIAVFLFRRLMYATVRKRFSGARPLISVLSKLIYLVGLKLVVDTMPLTVKAELWAENIIFVCATLLLLWILRRAAVLALEMSPLSNAQSPVLTQGFIPLVKNLITLFIFFMGTIMVLKRFNYDVMSLLTALGVGSLAVGLAAKDTLSNMISGFTLIIDRNLRPTDWITLGSSTGQVEEIGLRSTRIRLGDGNALIVPNSELVNTKIINLSQPNNGMNVTASFKVPHGTEFTLIKSICLEVLREMEKIDQSRAGAVSLSQIGEALQSIDVTFWVSDITQKGSAISEFNEKVLIALQKNSIALAPPPTLVLPAATALAQAH
ncbi:MAG: mechanosensitive ion channel family protein [Methylotenera sp.]|nr:mechanosensitive ion channel family protein [Oligoflexia bacterium]